MRLTNHSCSIVQYRAVSFNIRNLSVTGCTSKSKESGGRRQNWRMTAIVYIAS